MQPMWRALRALGQIVMILALASAACNMPSGESAPPASTAEPAPASTAEPVAAATASPSAVRGLATPAPRQTATSAPADLGAEYADPDGWFTLRYPEGWREHASGSEMQFWADRQGDIAVAVSIQVKALSADALADQFVAFLGERWDNYEVLSRETTALSGYPAVWVEQSWSWSGAAQRGALAAVVRNRVGVLLLTWCPEGDYTDMEPDLRATVQSLSLAEFAASPPYDEWETYTSDHFEFRYLADSWLARKVESLAEEHEDTLADITTALGVEYDDAITIFLYPSKEALWLATARDSGFAINEARETHEWWISSSNHQTLGHEMTHVITYWTLGDPYEALLGEGIAVCQDHSGRDPHAEAADLLAQGDLVPLDEMLGDAWFEKDAAVAYTESGSFACFLLERNGPEDFGEVYRSANLTRALKQVYGKDLATLEGEWLALLRRY